MNPDNDLAEISRQFGDQFAQPLMSNATDSLRQTHALLLGVGSIARPQTRLLRRVGVRQFTLVDPKKYSQLSVGLQCSDDEVGQFKVDVVGRELVQAGAQVRTFATDLFDLPEGVIDERTIVLLSVDNRRAEVGANHLATRMDVGVVKANVEPKYGIAAVRAFHPRHNADVCLECNFTDGQYERQRHPRSCDGGSISRRTASPPHLARAAASLAAMAFLGILDPKRRAGWLGYDVQFCTETLATRRSRLEPNPRCRWQHSARWASLQRLEGQPGQVSLADLVRRAEVESRDTVQALRFCHPVTVAARCAECATRQDVVRWIPHASVPVGDCRLCGGRIWPVPFDMHRELARTQLKTVWQRPLESWGVPPLAVIELRGDRPMRTYVMGKRSSQTWQRESS